jgi:rod shape-determining protein MreD
MKPSIWLRLDRWARHLTPFGFAFVLVILSVIPLQVPGFARVVPFLALIAVHHWTIYRPDLMPSYAVFLIGILQDLLSGTPLGVHAVVFLLVYGVVLWQRRFFVGKAFVITWLGFSIVSAVAALLTWALISAYYVSLVDPRALVYQYSLTLGFFPILAWVFLRWQQAFLKEE